MDNISIILIPKEAGLLDLGNWIPTLWVAAIVKLITRVNELVLPLNLQFESYFAIIPPKTWGTSGLNDVIINNYYYYLLS